MTEQANPKIRPAKGWFVLPIVLMVAGIFCAIFFGIAAARALDSGTVQMTLPGEATLQVDRPGLTPIFYEYRYNPQLYDNITFSFRHHESGETIRSYTVNYSSSYHYGNRSGVQIAVVDLPYAGVYTVTSDYQSGPELQIAFGNHILSFALYLMLAIWLGIFGIFGGIILLIIFAVARASSRKKLNAPNPPPFMPYYPPPHGGYAAPQYYYPPQGYYPAQPGTPPPAHHPAYPPQVAVTYHPAAQPAYPPATPPADPYHGQAPTGAPQAGPAEPPVPTAPAGPPPAPPAGPEAWPSTSTENDQGM